jgi:hypothetical protein
MIDLSQLRQGVAPPQAWASDIIAATMPRSDAVTDIAVLVTQTLQLTPIYLPDNCTITSIRMVTGATTAGTPLHWWYALYDSTDGLHTGALKLLGQTADFTTDAMAANTLFEKDLAAPVNITAAGIYLVGAMTQATTPNSLWGKNVGGVEVVPTHNGTYDGSLTTAGPTTAASFSAVVGVPLIEVI